MGRVTSKANEAKSKMKDPPDMPHAEVRTRMVVICGPTPYQLDHGGAPVVDIEESLLFTFRLDLVGELNTELSSSSPNTTPPAKLLS